MSIRFKCPHCKKPLVVKDHLAGKRAACPVCKKPVPIPVPVAPPADVESFAAAALADAPTAPAADASKKPIEMDCPFCEEPQSFSADLGGKQAQCSACKRIIKVPMPKGEKPRDWRDLIKKGPTAALVNLPEQLEGAWGTEQKTRVSGTALVEADALPEAELEPIGVAGWIKRVGLWGGIPALFILGYLGISKMTAVKVEKDDVRDTLAYLESHPDAPKLQAAELHRAIGELSLCKEKGNANDARLEFVNARRLGSDPKGLEEFERDMFLIDLIRAQREMGGSDEEDLAKTRIAWKDNRFREELMRTLEAMTLQARAVAVSELATWLAEKNQIEIAVGMAPTTASQVSLLLASKKPDMAENLLKKPTADEKSLGNSQARIGHAEGSTRLRNYAEAMKLLKLPGPAVGRLEAGLAAASVAMSDSQADKSASRQFLLEAIAAANEVKEKELSPLLRLQLIKLGARNHYSEVKDFVPPQAGSLTSWGQYYLFAGELSRSDKKFDEDVKDKVKDENHPAHAFAWELVARHNTQLGYESYMREMLSGLPDAIRPFVQMGIALGKKNPK
ncbi:MAG: hypothetical protein HY040_00945 [Planctomycetes bacterium]|nr:hypothetical protein [Planctomycetota bacterium]